MIPLPVQPRRPPPPADLGQRTLQDEDGETLEDERGETLVEEN